MRRALRAVLVLAACGAAGCLAAPVQAGTDVTLGSVGAGASGASGASGTSGATGASGPTGATGTAVEVATGPSGPSYAFPAGGGWVDSWQVAGGGQAGSVRLLILAPNGAGGFTVAAESDSQAAAPDALDSFPAPFLHGDAGDVIALSSSGTPLTFSAADGDQAASLGAPDPPVGAQLTTGAAVTATLVNVAASVTPPADIVVGTVLHHPPPAAPVLPPQPGSQATLPHAFFSFEIANDGPNEADGVTLTIAGPPGVALSGTGYGPAPTNPTGGYTPEPQVACASTSAGLLCLIGHLDPGMSVDYLIGSAVVPAGTYTATASASGTIGDDACPLSTCDPDQANDSATDTDNATGGTFQVLFLPGRAPTLASLRVRPARFSARASARRLALVAVTAQQTVYDSPRLVTQDSYMLLREIPGVRRAGGCKQAHGTRVPAGRRCTRSMHVASFTVKQAASVSALHFSLLTTLHRRTLAPGRYRLSATPSYTDLPLDVIGASTSATVSATIGPGACIGPPSAACPVTAVITRGATISTGFTVVAAAPRPVAPTDARSRRRGARGPSRAQPFP